jgi:hypothetical protein
MGEPIKQLQVTSDEQLELPESLEKTRDNYKAAKYGYQFNERDMAYIEYHTLRQKRQDTEEVTISKIIRLFDRDNKKEYLMHYQASRIKDFNNNYQSCPVAELVGVVPKPISNVSNDQSNRITDIKIIETQNEYTVPYSKEALIELFEKSKERHKIVCYAGYTRPTRVKSYDLIDGKRIIWNQERFVEADFKELMDKDDDNQKILDTKTAYTIPNKVREIKGEQQEQQEELSSSSKQEQKSKRVESLAEIAKDLKFPSKEESDRSKEREKDPSLVDTDKEFQELELSESSRKKHLKKEE